MQNFYCKISKKEIILRNRNAGKRLTTAASFIGYDAE
jgi:hypothetical protein